MDDAAMNVSMETRLVVNPNVVLREEGDEGAILFDPDSGAVRVLNSTAVAVWKLLEQERTVKEILGELRHQFEDVDADAEEQVLGLVQQLVRIGAVGTDGELSR